MRARARGCHLRAGGRLVGTYGLELFTFSGKNVNSF